VRTRPARPGPLSARPALSPRWSRLASSAVASGAVGPGAVAPGCHLIGSPSPRCRKPRRPKRPGPETPPDYVGVVIEADVAVVGAGTAGVSVAYELSGSRWWCWSRRARRPVTRPAGRRRPSAHHVGGAGARARSRSRTPGRSTSSAWTSMIWATPGAGARRSSSAPASEAPGPRPVRRFRLRLERDEPEALGDQRRDHRVERLVGLRAVTATVVAEQDLPGPGRHQLALDVRHARP